MNLLNKCNQVALPLQRLASQTFSCDLKRSVYYLSRVSCPDKIYRQGHGNFKTFADTAGKPYLYATRYFSSLKNNIAVDEGGKQGCEEEKVENTKPHSSDGPTMEQLENMKCLMEIEIKHFMTNRQEFRAYARDIVFENFWDPQNPVIVKGISSYAISAMKARFYIHFWYPKVMVSVIESKVDEAKGTVEIHWRINVLKQSKLFAVRKFSVAKMREAAREVSDKILGISLFKLDKNGCICSHTLRRVTQSPDKGHENTEEAKGDTDKS